MFKYTIPAFLQWLMPSYTWKVHTNDKQLFLTFDDGPHPQITPWVLNQLALADAKATFFCVADNVKKYPEIYQKILTEGHSVGNHTFHHLKGWKTKNEDYFADIEMAENYIHSNLFRPPYGKMKRSQAAEILKRYQIVMWNRLSCDYEQHLDMATSMSQMKKVSNGSILVFHDSEKAFKNLQVLLPELLNYYQTNGWEMKAITSK
jgi:peptidoglycan/xylan/chitin deacetylase (PgdA/CDA1 family)